MNCVLKMWSCALCLLKCVSNQLQLRTGKKVVEVFAVSIIDLEVLYSCSDELLKVDTIAHTIYVI